MNSICVLEMSFILKVSLMILICVGMNKCRMDVSVNGGFSCLFGFI